MFEWGDFNKLESAEDLDTYISERTEKRKEFFHYTSLNGINGILKSNSIRISNFCSFNDQKEVEYNKNNKCRCFSLCFSSGKNENLPLWYMYASECCGGRIRFTNGAIRALFDSDFYLKRFEDSNNAVESVKLEKDADFSIELRDVVYVKAEKDAKMCDMKYNTQTNCGKFSVEEIKKYNDLRPGFIKGIIWYYEKETRLLVKLSDNALRKLDIKNAEEYKVCVDLNDKIRKGMSIQFGPEITDIEEVIGNDGNDEIKKFLIDSAKVKLSDNAGMIKMRRNTK